MKSDESFFINNPTSIITNLTLLIKAKTLVSVYISSNESFLTNLIEVNKEHKALILDYGPNEAFNKKILANDNVQFKTQYEGIEVAFKGSKISKIRYDGEPAFMMPLPTTLFWQELRQFYRVKSPLSRNSFCQFALPEQEIPAELQLSDLSISGFSMRVYSSDLAELLIPESLAEQLLPDTQIENAKFILDGFGEDLVSFEVRYNGIINPNKVNKIQRIGCKFTQISPAFETTIQRYMQQIQREELQKKD